MSTNALPAAMRDDSALPDGPPELGESAPIPVSPRHFGGVIPEHETPQMLRAAVLRLAWPSIVENLLQSLVQIATTAMVSRLGADALAGVGVGNQLMQVGISTFFAVSTGTTVLVAYNIGAGNPREAGQAAKQSYFIGICLSVIVAVLGFLFSAPLIRLIGADANVVVEGAKFLRIEALGTIFLVTMFISSGILRGSGDTRTPMLVTLSINFINVAVSLPLIFGLGPLPHLGVVGAACGNIVARFIGSVVLVSIVWRGRRGVSIAGRQGWRPRMAPIKRLIDIGLPSMMESLFRSGGMTIFAAVIVSLGTTAYAAQQVANIFWQMTLFPGFGFSTAALTLTGQSLGANKPERAALATWVATRACTIWMASMGIVYFVCGTWLVIPFSAGDPEIRSIAANALKVLTFSMPIQATGLVLAGSLRGAGDTRWPMFSTGASMWFVRIPAAYLFGVVLGLGIPGAYIALIFDSAVTSGLNLWRYRSGRWKTARSLSAAPAR
jgi:putative MATE family efflux protein